MRLGFVLHSRKVQCTAYPLADLLSHEQGTGLSPVELAQDPNTREKIVVRTRRNRHDVFHILRPDHCFTSSTKMQPLTFVNLVMGSAWIAVPFSFGPWQ